MGFISRIIPADSDDEPPYLTKRIELFQLGVEALSLSSKTLFEFQSLLELRCDVFRRD